MKWFHELLNTKSPTLDPTMVGELNTWPPFRPLDHVPSRCEAEEAIRALANRKTVRPDGHPAGLLKRSWPTKENGTRSESSTISSSQCGGEVACRDNGDNHQGAAQGEKSDGVWKIIVGSPSGLTPAKYSPKSSRVALLTMANARAFCHRNSAGFGPSARRLT